MVKVEQALIVALTFTGVYAGQLVTPELRGIECQFRFHVVDPHGTPLDYRVKSFVPRLGAKTNLANRFVGTAISDLLPFAYDYELEPLKKNPNYSPLRGWVQVKGRSQWKTLIGKKLSTSLISINDICNHKGRVSPAPSAATANWVRLVGLYGDLGEEESPISSDGSFCLNRDMNGDFLMTVFVSGRLAHVRTISFLSGIGGRIEVKLGSK